MADSSEHVDRLISYRPAGQKRSFVKDEDLQIEVATDAECSQKRNKTTLKKMLTHSGTNEPKPRQLHDILRSREMGVEEEMKEAEATFQSMMEIRKTIEEAYLEFMRL